MKKKIIWAVVATALVVIVVVACKRSFEKFDIQATQAGALADCDPVTCEEDICEVQRTAVDTLPNIISGNLTLTSSKTWIMKGKVYVANGGQLTIPAGTLIKAIRRSTNDSVAALIVTRGGKINAEGREDCPIIFTSNHPTPRPGDWGGIVLLGKAPVNVSNPNSIIEGINPLSLPAGMDISYGGSLPNDTSGRLIYVRIEYAGVAIAADNELNGLTCGGVGRGTRLSFIQVYMGNDDAFEFFGGTVNADHLYAYVPNDDAFDFDLGYTGTIQFAVSILSDDNITDYSSNPNGIECDNNSVTPYTRPIISNMTIVGVCDSSKSKSPGDVLLHAAHFRGNSRYVLRNSVFMGFPKGVALTGNNGSWSMLDSVEIKNNVIQAFDYPLFYRLTSSPFTSGSFTLAVTRANKTIRYGGPAPKNANDSVKLVNPCIWTCPDFRPTTASYAASGANFGGFTNPTDDDYLMTVVTYKGAFAPCNEIASNWLMGWTKH